MPHADQSMGSAGPSAVSGAVPALAAVSSGIAVPVAAEVAGRDETTVGDAVSSVVQAALPRSAAVAATSAPTARRRCGEGVMGGDATATPPVGCRA
ncbi:MAG: hypothetical protein R2690_18985 [Acidimicrobiales bacterium]